jgi:cobalt/nickel transport system ATP-binding protein
VRAERIYAAMLARGGREPLEAVAVEHLSYRYPDGLEALRDVSFSVRLGARGPRRAERRGEVDALHLNGLLPERSPSAPAVRIFGTPVAEPHLAAVRAEVGLLFQDPDDQLFCPTVGEDVAFGPSQQGLSKDDLAARVAESLALVGLSGFEARPPHRLSAGEKRRACLAGVLACRARVLALDEPTSALDPRGRRAFRDLLRSLPVAQLVASHDLEFVVEVCPRVVVLDGGRVVAVGPTATVLRDGPSWRPTASRCPHPSPPAPALTPPGPIAGGRARLLRVPPAIHRFTCGYHVDAYQVSRISWYAAQPAASSPFCMACRPACCRASASGWCFLRRASYASMAGFAASANSNCARYSRKPSTHARSAFFTIAAAYAAALPFASASSRAPRAVTRPDGLPFASAFARTTAAATSRHAPAAACASPNVASASGSSLDRASSQRMASRTGSIANMCAAVSLEKSLSAGNPPVSNAWCAYAPMENSTTPSLRACTIANGRRRCAARRAASS